MHFHVRAVLTLVVTLLVAACTTEPEEPATTYQSQHLTATMNEDDSLMVMSPKDTARDSGLILFLFGQTSEIMSIATSDSSLIAIDGFSVIVAPKEGPVALTATYKNGSTRSYVLILQRIDGITASTAK